MVREVNRDVLIGFIEEAQSYLPSILEGIKAFNEDPARLDGLEEAHRYIHTIKGASSMIGLPGLSHIAHYVEETLEVIVAGTLDLTNESSDLLLQTVAQIGDYLDDLLDGRLKERPLVTDITRAFHRLRGLPVKEDAAILKQVLAEIDAAPNFGAEILPGETHDLETEAVSSELMEIFSMEADDHLRSISTLLAELEKTPGEVNLLQDIRRSVHTLKGAAGVVGFNSIAKLSHRMEDLLDLLYNGSLKIHPEILDLLFDTADALNDLMQGDYQGSDDQKELDRLYDRFSDWLMPDSILEQETTLNLDNQISVPDEKPIELSELPPFLEETAEERDIVKTGFSAGRRSSPLVRVPLDRLDELVNRVGEIVINRTTLEQEMGRLVQAVEELQSSAERLSRISTNLETQYEVSTFRSSAPRLKGAQPVTDGNAFLPDEDNGEQIDPLSYFDELEFDRYTEFHMLSRELSETTSDIKTIGSELSTSIGDFGSMLNRQGTISSELQEKLMRTRMVPLATLSTRFHRMVRTIARDQGKLVDLVIEGQDIELDKTVLEEMSDSLLHLLRNAVDHGIEPPSLRGVMGKPERGTITINTFQEGNQIVIQIKDDGAGLEPQLLRAKAISDGYISEADAAQISDDQLYSLIFIPGFSTAGEVSEISGRGVGLDIVKVNVNKLKGSINLLSTPGQSTVFTIRLPMTLAIMKAFLVKVRGETFAVPFNMITQIIRMEPDQLEYIDQEPVIRIAEQVYPLLFLGDVLDLEQPTQESSQRSPVLIINIEGEQIALVVDQLIEGREIVIKNLGSHLSKVHGISGATLMGDGSVVLILNPVELVRNPALPTEIQSRSMIQPPSARSKKPFTVMIVDDSVSVRRVVSNLIKNAGWHSITAKDGLEALEMIYSATQYPDLILLDIEMPRMDGYEFLSAIRAQDDYQHIPVVILTSRSSEKHRGRALELGASAYVIKPYQDETLLDIIRQQGQDSQGAAAA